MKVSLILESSNLEEGRGVEAFEQVMQFVAASVPDDCELLVADVIGSAEFGAALQARHGRFRRVEAVGLNYDASKMRAVEAAQGEFVVFLDGDCLPQPGWFEALTQALASGHDACAGVTTYGSGFRNELMSGMDFGCLFPWYPRNLECYASNNCGFRRSLLLQFPFGFEGIRCGCYSHAQRLKAAGKPVWLVPEARVVHEPPPFLEEHSRQGYDLVMSGRWMPDSPEHRLVRAGLASMPLLYGLSVARDVRNLWRARRDFGWSALQLAAAWVLTPWLRVVDCLGMVRGFLGGKVAAGWGGFNPIA